MASLNKDKHGLIGEGQAWPHWIRASMALLEKDKHGHIGEGQAWSHNQSAHGSSQVVCDDGIIEHQMELVFRS